MIKRRARIWKELLQWKSLDNKPVRSAPLYNRERRWRQKSYNKVHCKIYSSNILVWKTNLLGLPNMKGIKYLDLLFCRNHSLTKPNTCTKFEQNRRFELYHLLPVSAWFPNGHALRKKATIMQSSEINENLDTFYFEASEPFLSAYS